MDLYEYQKNKVLKKQAPLALRMRPKTLDEFIGQKHIAGENTLLNRAIKADKITSLVLYGPPGTGKTTLAEIIANTTKNDFVQLNATTSGIKDIKETAEQSKLSLSINNRRTILFIDEIHRFNKAQQDALLPHMEDGTLILIGATTENPYFEVNRALLSRSIIFRLNLLTKEDITKILLKAVSDKDNGLGSFKMIVDNNALDFLSDVSNGDARTALNALELAALTTKENEEGFICITSDIVKNCIQKRVLNYDKDGNNHYDTISAFIKSMRGSDPDAAVYYLAKMLYAGEDPKFIARRMVICASEDVGNADPHAVLVAIAAFQAAQFIGMPECRITLAQAAIYISCAPKSNSSYVAISNAMKDIANVQVQSVPIHLRDSSYSSAKEFGHGRGYKYSHDYDGNYVKQQYLPDELKHKVYYNPSDNGAEKKIKELLVRLKGDIY